MLHKISRPTLLLLLLATTSAVQAKQKPPPEVFDATPVPVAETIPVPNGSIYQAGGYAALTSGLRASRVGDVLTITLQERTNAGITNSTGTNRSGNIGLSPPSSGPLSLISSTDVNMGGDQSFKGKGDTVQSNSLTGEVSVTIAAVYPNGTMLVKGEKRLALNRGDEIVQFSGIVRSADITSDNRVPSWRVADAKINYRGRGDVARASRQGWLQRFFSVISPF
ncbi:MAG: flagellar basal body L-ring protein FlgH [Sphingorhabdus sp.]